MQKKKKYVLNIIFLLMWYFVDSWLKNEIIFAVFTAAENRRVDNFFVCSLKRPRDCYINLFNMLK